MSAPSWPTAPPDDGHVERRRQGPSRPPLLTKQGDAFIAGTLMLACTGLHIWAMFPPYPGLPATPVASLPHDVAMYLCLEAGWGFAAALVLTRASVRGGLALGAGLGAVEVGLLLTDVIFGFEAHTASAPGGWLALGGLGLGLAGVLLGASSTGLGSLRPAVGVANAARAVVALPVAVLAVVTFWLSWQSGEVVYTNGLASPINGDAFSQPAGLLAASLIAGLAIGIVTVLSAFWAPPGVGGWADLGVVIAMASQLVAGYVEVHEPLQDAVNFGVSKGIDVAKSGIALTPDWGANLAAAIGIRGLALWAAAQGKHEAATRAAGHEGTEDEQWPAGHRWPGT